MMKNRNEDFACNVKSACYRLTHFRLEVAQEKYIMIMTKEGRKEEEPIQYCKCKGCRTIN